MIGLELLVPAVVARDAVALVAPPISAIAVLKVQDESFVWLQVAARPITLGHTESQTSRMSGPISCPTRSAYCLHSCFLGLSELPMTIVGST